MRDWLSRADAAYQKGEFSTAAALLDRAIERAPNGVSAEAYAKRASIFLVKRNYAAGVRWIDDVAARAYPNDTGIRAQQALLLSHLPGRKIDAVVIAEAVLSARPRELALQLLVGDFYLREGNAPGKAVRAYGAFLAHRPDDVGKRRDKRVLAKLGFAHLLAGDPDAARASFERGLDREGDARLDLLARRGLCVAAASTGDAPAAVRLCERADKDAGNRADAPTVHHLARAYLAAGRHNSALQSATRLIELAPRRQSTYLLLGDILVEAGELDRADRQYRRAVLLARNSVVAYQRLGQLALRRTPPRAEQAIEWFGRAAKARPRDASLLADLASAYADVGDRANADPIAKRGLRLGNTGPAAARLYIVLGRTARAAGELDMAIKQFESALVAAGTATPVRDGRRRLVEALNERAVALFGAGKPDEAAVAVARAYALAPNDDRTLRNYAVIAIEAGTPARAVAALTVDGAPRNASAPVLRLLGRAAQRTGKRALAALAYRRALASAGDADPELVREIRADFGAVLLQEGDRDEAIALLEAAATGPAESPYAAVARRDLALARCLRGIATLDGDPGAALADLSGADALPEGDARSACRFARATALVATGHAKQGVAMLADLGPGPWLATSYGADGLVLARAYADYRAGGRRRLTAAARMLGPLSRAAGAARDEARAMVSAIYEKLAAQHARAGKTGPASVALSKALATAPDVRKPVIEHNRVALGMRRGNPARYRAALRKLGPTPPEALANLGIVEYSAGHVAAAVKLWKRARAAGVAEVDHWIEVAERLRGGQ